MENTEKQMQESNKKLVDDFFDGLGDDDNDSEIKGVSLIGKLIKHEPPYDHPCIDDFDDLRNIGYGGYGDMLNMNVLDIRDVRMLVNYYAFLNTESCKTSYERIKRDHRSPFFSATEALLWTIGNSKLCGKIPAHIGSSGLGSSASSVARIIMENSYDRGRKRNNYDLVRDEINRLVDELRYYFYAHIDHIDLKVDNK